MPLSGLYLGSCCSHVATVLFRIISELRVALTRVLFCPSVARHPLPGLFVKHTWVCRNGCERGGVFQLKFCCCCNCFALYFVSFPVTLTFRVAALRQPLLRGSEQRCYFGEGAGDGTGSKWTPCLTATVVLLLFQTLVTNGAR